MLTNLKQAASPRYVLLAYIGVVFLIGGGARDDIASLVVLRPLSVLVLAYALIVAGRQGLRDNRMLFGFATAWTALVALHLVPLPPELWHAFAGRELAIAVDAAVGMEDRWRPLSLVPYRTVNALFSLTVPLAGLVLATGLTRADLRLTLYAIALAAFASAALSLLQVIGGAGNPFYLYDVTNAGSAVGLFANRNHNAILLSSGIALLGAVTLLRQPPQELRQTWSAIVAGLAIALIPFLIITQSRAGLVLGLLALLAAFWLQSGPEALGQKRRRVPVINLRVVAAGIAALSLAGVTYLLTAGNALARLAQGGSADDTLRLRIWRPTVELVGQFFPAGSGIGTFVEIYEAAEPPSTLGPRYVNHAHNDILEVALTGGLPALAIIVAAGLAIGIAGWRHMRAASPRDLALRRAGLVVLVFLALGSGYDYPLRTPSLALLFVLAIIWFAGAHNTATKPGDKRASTRAHEKDRVQPGRGRDGH